MQISKKKKLKKYLNWSNRIVGKKERKVYRWLLIVLSGIPLSTKLKLLNFIVRRPAMASYSATLFDFMGFIPLRSELISSMAPNFPVGRKGATEILSEASALAAPGYMGSLWETRCISIS